MKKIILLWTLSCIFLGVAAFSAETKRGDIVTAPQNRAALMRIARSMVVKEMAQPPDWLPSPTVEPVFTIAWLSDMHIGIAEGAEERTRTALHFLRDTLKPDLTLFTGDSNAKTAPVPEAFKNQNPERKRHLCFRLFIEKELARPYFLVPGDNWPLDFEKVFGSPVRSFDYHGMHFVTAATDIQAPSNDSCAVFKDATKQWLVQDLTRNKQKPTCFIMHETIFPPSFLDAEWLDNTLSGNPQVFAAFSGHLHLDLEFKRGHWKQMICPSLESQTEAAFKLMRFYDTQIIILTYEFTNGQFVQAKKWQRVLIPEAMHGWASDNAQIVNNNTLTTWEKQQDETLAKRAPELKQALFRAAAKAFYP